MDQRMIDRMRGAGYGDEFLAVLARCQLEPYDPAGVGMQGPPSMTLREMEWVAREVGLELDRPARVTTSHHCVVSHHGRSVVHVITPAADLDITQPNITQARSYP